MSVECQVNVKSQSELDIGGRETCCFLTLTLRARTFEIDHKSSLRFGVGQYVCTLYVHLSISLKNFYCQQFRTS